MGKSRDSFTHDERKAQRGKRLWRMLFFAAVGLATYQTVDKAVISQNYRLTQEAFVKATDQGAYALKSEQERAGGFEAERNVARKENDGLRYLLGKANQRIESCSASTKMVGSGDWTGEVDLHLPSD